MKKVKKLPDYFKIVYSLRWSPEIEIEFGEKIDVNELYRRYKKLLGSWTVTYDRTLNNGLEFKPKLKNKLHFNKESFAEVGEVLHIIRKHKGTVAPTAGLHIHIDVEKFSNQEILKIIREFVAKQKFICQKFQVHGSRLDFACQLIDKKEVEKLTSKHIELLRTKGQPNQILAILQDKHHTLNLLNLGVLGSLEFRLFNSSIYLREIKKIVKFLFEFLIWALERT